MFFIIILKACVFIHPCIISRLCKLTQKYGNNRVLKMMNSPVGTYYILKARAANLRPSVTHQFVKKNKIKKKIMKCVQKSSNTCGVKNDWTSPCLFSRSSKSKRNSWAGTHSGHIQGVNPNKWVEDTYFPQTSTTHSRCMLPGKRPCF